MLSQKEKRSKHYRGAPEDVGFIHEFTYTSHITLEEGLEKEHVRKILKKRRNEEKKDARVEPSLHLAVSSDLNYGKRLQRKQTISNIHKHLEKDYLLVRKKNVSGSPNLLITNPP